MHVRWPRTRPSAALIDKQRRKRFDAQAATTAVSGRLLSLRHPSPCPQRQPAELADPKCEQIYRRHKSLMSLLPEGCVGYFRPSGWQYVTSGGNFTPVERTKLTIDRRRRWLKACVSCRLDIRHRRRERCRRTWQVYHRNLNVLRSRKINSNPSAYSTAFDNAYHAAYSPTVVQEAILI